MSYVAGVAETLPAVSFQRSSRCWPDRAAARMRIAINAVPFLESAEGDEVRIEDDGKGHIIAFELF